MDDRDTTAAGRGEVVGKQCRLLLQRADLVVQHELAPGDRTARVVDAWQPRPVGEVARDDAVVADRWSDDREHTFLFELGEGPLDVPGRARRQTGSEAAHELDGTV